MIAEYSMTTFSYSSCLEANTTIVYFSWGYILIAVAATCAI